jgi:hypothetical protein
MYSAQRSYYEPSETGWFDYFPPELIVHTLLFLDVKSICNFSQTCSAFNRLSSSNQIWRMFIDLKNDDLNEGEAKEKYKTEITARLKDISNLVFNHFFSNEVTSEFVQKTLFPLDRCGSDLFRVELQSHDQIVHHRPEISRPFTIGMALDHDLGVDGHTQPHEHCSLLVNCHGKTRELRVLEKCAHLYKNGKKKINFVVIDGIEPIMIKLPNSKNQKTLIRQEPQHVMSVFLDFMKRAASQLEGSCTQ